MGRDTKKQKTAAVSFEENEPPKNNSSVGAQSNISEFPEEERKPATTTSTTGSETQRKVFRGRKSARGGRAPVSILSAAQGVSLEGLTKK
jgi:hypothetical protein